MTDLAEQLDRTVREALREEAFFAAAVVPHDLAPPRAIESERQLVSALLCRTIELSAIAPLTPDDFFSRFHGEVVRALAQVEPGADLCATVIERIGATGVIERAIFELRDDVPYLLPRYVREHITLVHDAARRRRLSGFLDSINVEIRLGYLNADQALAKLRDALNRGRRA